MIVSILGWGTHNLAPLSFRAATYSGVFTLLPMLTGRGRQLHADEGVQQDRHHRDEDGGGRREVAGR